MATAVGQLMRFGLQTVLYVGEMQVCNEVESRNK